MDFSPSSQETTNITFMCLCLISHKYTWLCTRGKISLNSLKYINHNYKDTNNPVKDEAAKVALNSTLSENSNCYSYIKAWAMGLIWASSVPQSLCYALAQHTHSCPCLQLYNLFYVLPDMLGFSLTLWLLAIIGVIWIKCLSLREEQHCWVTTGICLYHTFKNTCKAAQKHNLVIYKVVAWSSPTIQICKVLWKMEPGRLVLAAMSNH